MFSNDFSQFKKVSSILRFINEEGEDNKQQIQNTLTIQNANGENEPIIDISRGEFDPAIQIGRGNKLYLKRNYIERLIKETRYTEIELNDIKEIYVSVAELGKGLNLEQFKEFLRYVYNIDSHVLAKRLFYFFDKNRDGIVEYFEVIKSLDLIEKGDFDEKVELCFRIYDPDEMGYVDAYGLRELFKLCYINIISTLEKCIVKIQQLGGENEKGITWKQLNDSREDILNPLKECLPIVLDRYDAKRITIENIEIRSGFTIDKLDNLLKLYRSKQKTKIDTYNKQYLQNETDIPSSAYITLNQFKLIVMEAFKITDNESLNSFFNLIDSNQEGSVTIENLVTEMVFHLKGPFEKKFMLFFDANSIFADEKLIISKRMLIKYLTNHLKFFEEVFKSAQDIAKHLTNVSQDKIYLESFKKFCAQFPSAMDFLAKITIGDYPSFVEADQQNESFNNQKSFDNQEKVKREFPWSREDQVAVYKEKTSFNKRWIPRSSKPF